MASIRNFIISFLLSLTVFSVIAYFGIDFVVDIMLAAEETPDDSQTADRLGGFTSDATGIVSLLLVGTDEYVYTPDSTPTGHWVEGSYEALVDADRRHFEKDIIFMSLVSFNSNSRQVTVTALPAEMTVEANDWELDLESAYYFSQNELYGLTKDYFAQAISATVGMQIDYSATIDIDDYVQMADNLGGIEVNCPEDASEAGITKGIQLISSEQLRTLLTKSDYEKPESKEKFVTNLTVSALDRICSTAYYIDAFEEFERIRPMLQDTEFDEDALAQWRPLIFSYKFYTLQKLSPIGSYAEVDGKTVFNIDRGGTRNYFKQYMQNDQT